MLTLPPSVRIYLATAPVDMRCGHDGLAATIRNQWKLDLFGGHLVLYYKRLERGKFRLPTVTAGATSVMLDATELAMLLDGIDVSRVRRPPRWAPPPALTAPMP